MDGIVLILINNEDWMTQMLFHSFIGIFKDVKQMTTTFKTHANNQELLQDNNNQFGDNMVMNNGHNEEGNQLRTENLGENLDRPEIPVVSKKVFSKSC